MPEIGDAISAVLGKPLPIHPFDGGPVGSVGRTPWSVPRPYVLDTQRANALGWDGGKDYAEEIADVCDWALWAAEQESWDKCFPLSEVYGANVFNYEAEDEFMAGSAH